MKFPRIGCFMNSGSNEQYCHFFQSVGMDNRHVVVCAVFVITVFCRTKHIYRNRIVFETVNRTPDKGGNARIGVASGNKRQAACNPVIAF